MTRNGWDEIDRYVVISADSHAGADLRDYKPYLAREWHDQFDAWAASYVSPYDDLIHATAVRNWDSEIRISEMDADGVSGEIILPNTVPPFFPTSALIILGLPTTEEELAPRWAGVQAHNRWVVDFVAQAPQRRRGIVQIFPNDVDAAIAELRWARDTGVFGAALLAQVPPGHPVPPLFHTRYEPLWAACDELDLPIVLHDVATPIMPLDQPASAAVTVLKGYLWLQSTLIDMIVSGVFERYPNLKLVPTESGLEWPLRTAQGIDVSVASMKPGADNRSFGMFAGESIAGLSLTPSEYVLRNVYYGLSAKAATPESVALRDEVGVDHIMWGTDYPHEEGSTPQSLLALRWAFADVPEREVRQMLAGTAARLYGFDLDALARVAQRVGPLVSEVHRPVQASDFELPVSDFVRRPFPGGALLARSRAADSRF